MSNLKLTECEQITESQEEREVLDLFIKAYNQEITAIEAFKSLKEMLREGECDA